MHNLDYNPVAEAWEARYNSLSPDAQRRVDVALGSSIKLIEIKRKHPKIRSGDVFLVQPREGIYFYGYVIKADLKSKTGDNELVDGAHTAFIFSNKTQNISMGEFTPDFDKVICGPFIVTKGYWTRGLFYSVGNIPLSEDHEHLDYGFFKLSNGFKPGFYCNEREEILDEKPKYLSVFGTVTINGIAWELETEFIINPQLLEFDE